MVIKGWLLVFLYDTRVGDLLLDWFERLTGLAIVPVEQVASWVDLEVKIACQEAERSVLARGADPRKVECVMQALGQYRVRDAAHLGSR